MILTGEAIRSAVESGEIIIDPFDDSCVGPNSYDFHWGGKCRTYDHGILDSAANNASTLHRIGPEGLLLKPDCIYLLNTHETIGSSKYVPIIRGRSSIARLGVFVHVTADLIDLGSINRLTLQVHAVIPTRLYPLARLGQVTFWQTSGEIQLYNGKYRHSESPAGSLSFKDFSATANTEVK